MNKVVLLDVDGVLADFMKHALVMYDRMDLYPPKHYSVAELLGLDRKTWWAEVDSPVFWSTVPVYKGAHEFVSALLRMCEVQGFELRFCTASGGSTLFPACRTKWLEQFCRDAGVSVPVIIVQSTEDKGCVVGPGTILIDDSDVAEEVVVEAGGHVILIPQRWNRRYSYAGELPDYELVLQETRRLMYEIESAESLEDYADKNCDVRCRNYDGDSAIPVGVGNVSDY